MMDGKYKFWMTQGQGCGELPDAVFDTLEEALNEARSAFGEGSVGIQLPDGSWHEFAGEEWDMRASVTLLRMRKDKLNPKQRWLLEKWQEADFKPRFLIEWLRHGGHTFNSVWSMARDRMGEGHAQKLLLDSLTWGLFDIFEYPTGSAPTDAEIDWIVGGRKGQ